MRFLLATIPEDYHALAVAEALRRRGHEPLLWFTSDFPSVAAETVLFGGAESQVHIEGPGTELIDLKPDAVWYRRVRVQVDDQILHPADTSFAHDQCAQLRAGLFGVVGAEAFWVNPRDHAIRAENKIRQHYFAQRAGLAMPATLYSNQPDRIRAFIADQGGEIVYKPLRAHTWRDDDTHWVPYTALIGAEQLVDDDLLRATPGIYQALVPKAFELRVTFIGERAFAAKVKSQETEIGQLDYRRAYHELALESYDLPGAVAERCRALMRALGLVFGCFDFIVTPTGEHVFLEVNQAGQWLFIEATTGLPLLDAFCELMIQRRPNYDWDPDRVGIRLADVEPACEEALRESLALHPLNPDPAHLESGIQ